MKILSENAKTGWSINFPIEETCDKSCPFYQDKTCYGLKGRFMFGVVRKANTYRLFKYREAPELFFIQLEHDVKKLLEKGVTHLRVNGIGDTPDMYWAELFTLMASRHPEMKFWVSTRKYYIWEKFFLDNVTVRYSGGYSENLKSHVTNEIEYATCPATRKEVKTCSECGHRCWDKQVQSVTYLKH